MRISDWSSDVCSSDLQDAARSAAPARPRGPIDMTRTVHCQYENKDAEGLDFVPWPGELGKRVFANVGKAGWAAWLAHQTMLINENRLSPLDPKHRDFLETDMEKILFGGGPEQPGGPGPPARTAKS